MARKSQFAGGGNSTDILYEIRQMSSSLRKDCNENMQSLGVSLRDDIRKEVGRILQALRRDTESRDTNGVRKPISESSSLRVVARQTNSPAWDGDVVDNLPVRPPRHVDASTSAGKPITDLEVRSPSNAPPMMPGEVPDDPDDAPPPLPVVNDSPPLVVNCNHSPHSLYAFPVHDHAPHAAVRPIVNFEEKIETIEDDDGDYASAVDSDREKNRDGQSGVGSSEGTDFKPVKGSRLSRAAPFFKGTEVMSKQKSEESHIHVKGSRQRISISREKARVEARRKSYKPLRQMSIEEFIQTSVFDNMVGIVILMNAASIGVQTDYNAKNLTDDVPLGFFIMEQFFCVWFTSELALRLYVYRCSFFRPFAEGWVWNYFDSFVVAAQLLEVFFELVARSASVDASKFRVLRVLRILRLVRILRVVRVLHLISELRAIVSSIVGSFRSLVWVVVLLFLMMYIVGVFFTQSITNHVVDAREDDGGYGMSEEEETLLFYFGSLGRAILSLWQSMSGGLDWDSLCGPLFTKISFVTGFAFACFVAFALLALMNVVTGVFVQTALLSARDEEDAFMTSQIVSLFDIANRAGSAKLRWEEVVESLEDPRQEKEWKAIGVQTEDARYLFKLLDLEESGEVAFEEFMGGALRLTGPAKALDVLTIMQETRLNQGRIEDKMTFLGNAITEMRSSAEHSHHDMTHLTETCSSHGSGLEAFSGKLHKELDVIKSMLKPVSVLEDMGSIEKLLGHIEKEPFEAV